MKDIPEVFFIESSHPGDTKEGGIIDKILEMGKRLPIYRYIHTRDQFRSAIDEFSDSNYR